MNQRAQELHLGQGVVRFKPRRREDNLQQPRERAKFRLDASRDECLVAVGQHEHVARLEMLDQTEPRAESCLTRAEARPMIVSMRRPWQAPISLCAVGTLLAGLLLAIEPSTAGAVTADTSEEPSPATFTDPTGDSLGAAPDLSSIVISIDGTGLITIQIRASEAALAAGHAIYLDLDSDQNAATGNPDHFGADYVLSIVGPANNFGAVRWQSANWQSIQLASLRASYANGLATFTVNESDLAPTTGFNFYVVSQVGTSSTPTDADWSPDRGTWHYAWRTAALTLSVTRFSAPRRVKAGRVLFVAMESRRSDTGEIVGIGARVRCQARLGGKTVLRPRFAGFETVESESVAVCAFRAPTRASGKTIRGSITVSFGGSSVSHAFATRVL